MTDDVDATKEPVLRDADAEPDDTAAEVPDVKEAKVPEGED